MYFCKSSRFVLRKVQLLPPSPHILIPLIGNDKSLSTKYPKEDSSKPALRVNIPSDNEQEHYAKIIRDEIANEPRSKSLVRGTRDPSVNVDNGYLQRLDSEMEVSKFGDEEEEYEQKDRAKNVRNNSENIDNQYRLSDVPLEEKEYIEGLLLKRQDKTNKESLGGDYEVTVKGPSNSESEPKNNADKTFYIIIDVPENREDKFVSVHTNNGAYSKENQPGMDDFGSVKKTPAGQSEKKPKLRVNFEKNSSLSEKGKSKSLSKLTFQKDSLERGNSNSKIQSFEVHDTDDTSTYIFHLKFKRNFGEKANAVGCVPERELDTRTQSPEYCSTSFPDIRTPVVGKKLGKEVTMAEDKPEIIRYPEKISVKLKSSKAQSPSFQAKYRNVKNSAEPLSLRKTGNSAPNILKSSTDRQTSGESAIRGAKYKEQETLSYSQTPLSNPNEVAGAAHAAADTEGSSTTGPDSKNIFTGANAADAMDTKPKDFVNDMREIQTEENLKFLETTNESDTSYTKEPKDFSVNVNTSEADTEKADSVLSRTETTRTKEPESGYGRTTTTEKDSEVLAADNPKTDNPTEPSKHQIVNAKSSSDFIDFAKDTAVVTKQPKDSISTTTSNQPSQEFVSTATKSSTKSKRAKDVSGLSSGKKTKSIKNFTNNERAERTSKPPKSSSTLPPDKTTGRGKDPVPAIDNKNNVPEEPTTPRYYSYCGNTTRSCDYEGGLRHSDSEFTISSPVRTTYEKKVDKPVSKSIKKPPNKPRKGAKCSESCPDVKIAKAPNLSSGDTLEFQRSSSVINISCDNLASNPTRYCSAFPPILIEAMRGRGKNFGFKRDGLFNDKWVNRVDFRPKDFEMNPKSTQVSDYSENSILFPKKLTEKFDSNSLFSRKDDIMHVAKDAKEESPKISDNMMNMANDNLTEDKGKPSVDSLTMMKKVKEIIDFDLNNAIKIFDGKPSLSEKLSSVVVFQNDGWRVNEKELKECIEAQANETNIQIHYANSTSSSWVPKIQEESRQPIYLPSKKEKESMMKLGNVHSNSVITYDPRKNEFRVNLSDLEKPTRERKDETFNEMFNNKTNPATKLDNIQMEMKSGDSILVFDEESQSWKVDYSILEKRQRQLREEEELTKRSEFILETIEELEKGQMKNITIPGSRDRRVFDYGKEEWRIYKPDNTGSSAKEKSIKPKSPFKESDAEEIRRKNSDLYENLFVKKETKKEKDSPMIDPPNSKQKANCSADSKETMKASDMTSGQSGKTPTPTEPEPPKPNPEPSQKEPNKEAPSVADKEEDNYWGSFLRMNILPRTISEIPKSKVPPPPPKPPGKPPSGQPPKVDHPLDKRKKIEEPKFRIPLPFGDRKKNEIKTKVPPPAIQKEDIPNIKPAAPGTEKAEEPKLKTPLPPKDESKIPVSKTKEIPKLRIPIPFFPLKEGPSKTTPAAPKEEPKLKTPSPLNDNPKIESPTSIPSKEDPTVKPPVLTPTPPREETKMIAPPPSNFPKEDPRNKKSPPTIGAPNSSTGKKLAENSQTNISEFPGFGSTLDGKDKKGADHYISENIIEISRSTLKDKNSRIIPNKIETVKVNITADKRMPSKITEINLNKKCEETMKESTTNSDKPKKQNDRKKPLENLNKKERFTTESKTFYKNLEKYKTPFSDPDYEEKSIKIKSDLESNPNLKKLDNWNKTLVLHDIGKSPENIENWLKDETDKMATLLLKVLQEAADGKPTRKKPSAGKSKSCEKLGGRGNPYDNIRKKQETSPENFLFKVRSVNIALDNDKKPKLMDDFHIGLKTDDIPVQSAKTAKPPKVIDAVKILPPTFRKENSNAKQINMKTFKIEPHSSLDKPKVESVLKATDSALRENQNKLELMEDIPGPQFLKRISGAWKMFPTIGCQMTVATLFRIFQLVNLGTSFFNSPNPDKSRRQAFGKLFNKYGPIVNIQGPISGNVILIHKPEHLTAIFEQDATVPVRSVFDSLEQGRREVDDKILTTGTAIDWTKPQWNELKKLASDPLIKGCEKFYGMLEVAAESLVNTIERNRNGQNRVSEDFMDEIKRWSLEGLCNVIFEKYFRFLEGRTKTPTWVLEPDKLYMAVEEATEYLIKCEKGFQSWRLMTTPSSAGLGQAYRSLAGILSRQLYQAEINLKNKNERLKEGGLTFPLELTFLESMLLNDGMTPEDVTCNLVDILLIGSNTLNSALGFVLYNLAQNVTAQKRLLNELKEVLPEKSNRLDYHKLHSLKYLQACVKESLRLNMPFPIFFRLLQNDILVGNYVVPKGTHVVMDFRVSCMKEQNFDDPEKFIPERWLIDDKSINNIHPFSVFPFCHGPRTDLAKRVVEMQLWACIAKIVRNFEVEYNFGEIQGTDNVISLPDKPLKLNFVSREC